MKTDSLRHFIRATLMDNEGRRESMKKIPLGAGIVVVRQFSQGWRVLGLIINNIMDIPKGGIDPGENALQAALRETHEEAGISELDFKWGTTPIVVDKITVYVASTQQDPVIVPHHTTGIYEHQGYKWLSWNEILTNTYPYLQPAIVWARDLVEGLQPTKNQP